MLSFSLSRTRRLTLLTSSLSAVIALSSPPALAAGGTPAVSKDKGPASAACDRFDKASPAWTSCAGSTASAMPAEEAFYAGYWLAKSGRYEEALRYLSLASPQDPRVLTYIGYATRKLGRVDAALVYYGRALSIDPNYAVARAYLGDAYLTKGAPLEARGQLAEIANRCGTSCAEYAELAAHIADFDARSVTR